MVHSLSKQMRHIWFAASHYGCKNWFSTSDQQDLLLLLLRTSSLLSVLPVGKKKSVVIRNGKW